MRTKVVVRQRGWDFAQLLQDQKMTIAIVFSILVATSLLRYFLIVFF